MKENDLVLYCERNIVRALLSVYRVWPCDVEADHGLQLLLRGGQRGCGRGSAVNDQSAKLYNHGDGPY